MRWAFCHSCSECRAHACCSGVRSLRASRTVSGCPVGTDIFYCAHVRVTRWLQTDLPLGVVHQHVVVIGSQMFSQTDTTDRVVGGEGVIPPSPSGRITRSRCGSRPSTRFAPIDSRSWSPAAGFIAGFLAGDTARGSSTVSLWRDEEAMRAFLLRTNRAAHQHAFTGQPCVGVKLRSQQGRGRPEPEWRVPERLPLRMRTHSSRPSPHRPGRLRPLATS